MFVLSTLAVTWMSTQQLSVADDKECCAACAVNPDCGHYVSVGTQCFLAVGSYTVDCGKTGGGVMMRKDYANSCQGR